jgi:hypothetical protein
MCEMDTKKSKSNSINTIIEDVSQAPAAVCRYMNSFLLFILINVIFNGYSDVILYRHKYSADRIQIVFTKINTTYKNIIYLFFTSLFRDVFIVQIYLIIEVIELNKL